MPEPKMQSKLPWLSPEAIPWFFCPMSVDPLYSGLAISYRGGICDNDRLWSLSNLSKNFSCRVNSLSISHEGHYSPVGLMDPSLSLKAEFGDWSDM